MNAILASGVVFLVLGIGLQAYGLAQLWQCAYASSPKANCSGLTVLGNGLSLFLILVGVVAIVRARQSGSASSSPLATAPSRSMAEPRQSGTTAEGHETPSTLKTACV